MSDPVDLKALIRTIPGYPKPGILFRDITTLLADPGGFRRAVDLCAGRYARDRIDKVAGIEARGFILGGAIAHRLGAGFVPIRKKGKLPHVVVGHDYQLEYGSDRVEMHLDAISPGERVLLVDDLIATGVVECCFVIDLPDLGGRQRLERRGHDVFTLVEFEGG